MPFIKQERRRVIDVLGLQKLPDGIKPGDLCYTFFKPMMDKWKQKPSWTTAHGIYKQMSEELDFLATDDERVAYRLAWEVFFQLEVIPYERLKREENGDVS